MNSTYLSHLAFNEMEVAWRHQVVQKHTAFPQSSLSSHKPLII